LIEEGAVGIYKAAAGGNERLIATLSRGDIVGEMALVDSTARGATAKAEEHTRVAVISRAFFESRLQGSNPMIRLLLTSLTKRIRDTNYSAVNAPCEGWRPISN
jgi:CRP-like cAMP-binding protein